MGLFGEEENSKKLKIGNIKFDQSISKSRFLRNVSSIIIGLALLCGD